MKTKVREPGEHDHFLDQGGIIRRLLPAFLCGLQLYVQRTAHRLAEETDALSRDQTCQPLKIQMLARSLLATYVVFDLLYHYYQSLLNEPLRQRRAQLGEKGLDESDTGTDKDDWQLLSELPGSG